ncbi:hypothetical protein ACJMK2_004442 [Sinanodonta woodiana]|uniref:Protein kinase domain-containing protein n=1 Tax=Sinanodonta woodiana TaxID=1069815 RepID=A0ABD3Y2G8_SINWO
MPENITAQEDVIIYRDTMQIEFDQLQFQERLGEGTFGKVMKAVLRNNSDGAVTTNIIAVKTLKDMATEEEYRNLLREIEAMKIIGSHPNIVTIIGFCTCPTVCLVMDYCPFGDLRNYLIKYKEKIHGKTITPVTNSHTRLNMSGFLESGISQTSESTGFVHIDLAARNILVSHKNHVKISDFGLARDISDHGCYQATLGRRVPYKWMAIEALSHSYYTVKSDVWSFGVVVWEIMTFGGSPYPSVPNKDLLSLLLTGYRMEKPENCTPEVYQIILSCWHQKPDCRPTFSQLRENIENMMEAKIAGMEHSVGDDDILDDSLSISTFSESERQRTVSYNSNELVSPDSNHVSCQKEDRNVIFGNEEKSVLIPCSAKNYSVLTSSYDLKLLSSSEVPLTCRSSSEEDDFVDPIENDDVCTEDSAIMSALSSSYLNITNSCNHEAPPIDQNNRIFLCSKTESSQSNSSMKIMFDELISRNEISRSSLKLSNFKCRFHSLSASDVVYKAKEK